PNVTNLRIVLESGCLLDFIGEGRHRGQSERIRAQYRKPSTARCSLVSLAGSLPEYLGRIRLLSLTSNLNNTFFIYFLNLSATDNFTRLFKFNMAKGKKEERQHISVVTPESLRFFEAYIN